MNKKTKIKYNQDRLYYIICYAVVAILTLIVLYPVVYIVSASFSNPDRTVQGDVWLWPVDINLDAYKMLFNYQKLWTGYGNTILYTVGGTIINLVVTLTCAYPMARKNLRGRSQIMFLFSFTMLFSGGMIPNYILVRELGIMNTRWALLLPGAMSVYNMIVCRTFIQTNIPDEMLEAAQIDGCNDLQFLFRMVLPLSKPIIAVLALWYGVSHWNAYFNAFLYLKDNDLYPLQIFLREILFASSQIGETEEMLAEEVTRSQYMYVAMQYCVIVVSTAPLMCIYPFVQKHFQKGVMVGSVKG
ncbi:MAG: carbohydrate ABC transporter permease [Lachnospiraceae bacterium]|nr:carbohydrate ABC transporter permease [Lachnospiraceae bacterium]